MSTKQFFIVRFEIQNIENNLQRSDVEITNWGTVRWHLNLNYDFEQFNEHATHSKTFGFVTTSNRN